ncbi:MAG: ABC transporter permease [Chryseolinea sp.]
MLKNYFRVAFRNFQRNKIFSFIHILGLSIGISASIVIFVIAKHELTFDKFEPDGDRIYKVVMDFKFGDMKGSGSAIPAPIAPAIANEVTGVEATVPVMQFQGNGTVTVAITRPGTQQQTIIKKQAEIVFTNDDYFKLIPFEWITGNAANALSSPFSTVLTESRAIEYFPGLSYESIIGREIIYDKDLSAYVTGIVKDLDQNTDFTSLEFISYGSIAKTYRQDSYMMNVWSDWMAYSKAYVKLSRGTEPSSVTAQLNRLIRKYDAKSLEDPKNSRSFSLLPLNEIHFSTTYAGYGQRVANKDVLLGLLAIAAFLLLLGCINFINLSTAQATIRAKEIGIRKTIGGLKKQLISQFLIETFCITSIAAIVSIGITPLILQIFGDFLPPGLLQYKIWADAFTILFVFVLVLVVAGLSGFYPAIILSALQPVQALKNRITGGATRSGRLRKVLTVSQFLIAQFFVIGAFMVSKQIHFSINQDLGYRKDAILNFETPRDTTNRHVQELRNKIALLSGVEVVSVGFSPPAIEGMAFGNFSYQNGKQENNNVQINVRWGDSKFLPLYNIKILAGRNISQDRNDEAVINETYSKTLGFAEPTKAIGEHLLEGKNHSLTIVGVMGDFHEGTSRMMMGPLVFKGGEGNIFHIGLASTNNNLNDWQATIANISKAFQEIYPSEDFTYSFFDETIANFYAEEQKTSKLLNWAMGLSIVISCLGLLGLVLYTSETRKKEVGIRKILGASVTAIVSLLSIEFVHLVLIAFALAAPIAWYAVDRWLEYFAYKTSISWWVFAGSGLFLLAVAMITLSFKTIGVARSNPIAFLRTD